MVTNDKNNRWYYEETQPMTSQKWQVSHEGLSKRALEILGLLNKGLSDREIAEHLVMTINTVKWYNRQIYSALNVGSRTQAIARARELRLLDADPEAPVISPESHPTPKHNLPVKTTHFIGRRDEIQAIKYLLDSTHLLTLTGSPGTGKTRLALQIAWEIKEYFRDGVYFVSLAPLSDPALVTTAVANAIGVTETPGQPLLETLKDVLQTSQMLLIVDNFEHLLSAVTQISELTAAAPHLKVLATSRERLHLYGEQEYAVAPLELPDPEHADPQMLANCESAALFIQQARAAKPDFELTPENALAIAKICVRLDGLPLAIELAAARIKLLTPTLLLNRLTSRLDTLTGGAHDLPARQQTLRNTIAWSYNLLEESDKMLFARLAVFAGGWSLDAAESVCDDAPEVSVLDGLASLLDKSLIQKTEDNSSEPRFAMLETIHEYALERLQASADEELLRRRHADYFTHFAERSGKALYSRYQSRGLTNLETEQNNFRAVLSWSLAGNPEPGLRLIAALGACWRIRSYLVEGFNWARHLLAVKTNVAPEVRANALSSTSRLLACYIGNYADAERMSREALELARQSSDQRSIAEALYARGTTLMETRSAEARVYFNEALTLFQALEDQWSIAQTLNVIGEVERLEGNYEAAEALYRQALALFQQFGNLWGANIALQNLAYIAQHQHDYERARSLFRESLANSQELQDQLSIANCLGGLAGILNLVGQPQQATRLFGAAEALRSATGAQIQPADRSAYEHNVAKTREQLDPEIFAACWQEGLTLSLDEVITTVMETEVR